MPDTPVPMLVAHRGYLQHYPENTWRALQAALQAGACWVEFDVQMCRDGRFVLMHDDNLLRTAGVDQSVLDSSSDQLAASVHEPERLGTRFEPTPVPLLDAVLERLATWPGVRAMVEIKQESLDRWGLDNVMQRLLPALRRHPGLCVLISYNPEALAWLRARTDLPVGWVLTEYAAADREQAARLAPDFLICNERKLPPDEHPWAGPWQWMLYDIVDPQQALAWAARGVALIETADIGTLLQDPRLARQDCQRDPL